MTGFPLVVGPYACLYLAYMRLLQEKHAESGLAYASAYAQRQFACQEAFMEIEVLPFGLAGQGELALERSCIDPYTHG